MSFRERDCFTTDTMASLSLSMESFLCSAIYYHKMPNLRFFAGPAVPEEVGTRRRRAPISFGFGYIRPIKKIITNPAPNLVFICPSTHNSTKICFCSIILIQQNPVFRTRQPKSYQHQTVYFIKLGLHFCVRYALINPQQRGACVSRLRYGCLCRDPRPDLGNANVGK